MIATLHYITNHLDDAKHKLAYHTKKFGECIKDYADKQAATYSSDLERYQVIFKADTDVKYQEYHINKQQIIVDEFQEMFNEIIKLNEVQTILSST